MNSLSAPTLSSLLQIAMPVQEITRAVAFYRDVLGVRLLFQAGNLAFFDLDGVRLLIEVPEDAEFRHPGSILYFRVPEIDAAYEGLRGRGVAFMQAPHVVHRDERHELWMAFFRDGEGNVHAIAAEVPLAR